LSMSIQNESGKIKSPVFIFFQNKIRKYSKVHH
jgi:hypothetical protein